MKNRILALGAILLVAVGLTACGPKTIATMGTDQNSFAWQIGCTIVGDDITGDGQPDYRVDPAEDDFQMTLTNSSATENVYRIEWVANDGAGGLEFVDMTGDTAANSTSELLTLFPPPAQDTRVDVRMIRKGGAVVNKIVGFYDPVDYCYNHTVEVESYFANGNSIKYIVGCQAEAPNYTDTLTASITNTKPTAAVYSIGAGTPYAKSVTIPGQDGIESPSEGVSWSSNLPPQGTVLHTRASNGTIVSTYKVDYCGSLLPPA